MQKLYPREYVVRYIEALCYILKYNDIATIGKLFLLASPRLRFCLPVQVSGFLVWSAVLCDCLLCGSVQGFAFSRLLVWSGFWSGPAYERAKRACIAKRIAFPTKPTRCGFDNIYE